MEITNKELEKKKKQMKEMCDEFFSLSKHDIENKEVLLEKIRKLENEIQENYMRLNRVK